MATSEAGRKKNFLWPLILGLITTVFLVLFFLWFGFRIIHLDQQTIRMTQTIADNQKMMSLQQESSQKTQETVQKLITQLESRLTFILEKASEKTQPIVKETDQAKEPQAQKIEQTSPWPEFFWYSSTDKDTLWNISARFYGHGRNYPVLLAMNPELDIYEIKAGRKMKILKVQKEAIKIYHDYVQGIEPAKYFWYQVKNGDTLEALSKKFYKSNEHTLIIQQLNPRTQLKPGQRLRILLRE